MNDYSRELCHFTETCIVINGVHTVSDCYLVTRRIRCTETKEDVQNENIIAKFAAMQNQIAQLDAQIKDCRYWLNNHVKRIAQLEAANVKQARKKDCPRCKGTKRSLVGLNTERGEALYEPCKFCFGEGIV